MGPSNPDPVPPGPGHPAMPDDALPRPPRRRRRKHPSTVDAPPDADAGVIIDLEQGRLRAVRCVRDVTTITCLRGTIWLTHEADLDDVVLHEGQAAFVPGNCKAVLLAVCDAVIVIRSG